MYLFKNNLSLTLLLMGQLLDSTKICLIVLWVFSMKTVVDPNREGLKE